MSKTRLTLLVDNYRENSGQLVSFRPEGDFTPYVIPRSIVESAEAVVDEPTGDYALVEVEGANYLSHVFVRVRDRDFPWVEVLLFESRESGRWAWEGLTGMGKVRVLYAGTGGR